jgi:hypothetical protein
MADPIYPILYTAPEGVTLRKAEHPPGGAPAAGQEAGPAEYARAPSASGAPDTGVRLAATRRNLR